MKEYCESITKEILFGGSSLDSAKFDEVLKRHGLQYRKGKTFSDACKYVRLGVRQGSGRTESEISMVEVHLRVSVLKRVKS